MKDRYRLHRDSSKCSYKSDFQKPRNLKTTGSAQSKISLNNINLFTEDGAQAAKINIKAKLLNEQL